MKTYKTTEVAKIIGVHPNTVRLYEEWQLIPKVQREENGYRLFTDLHIEQFKLARTALKVEILQNGLRKKMMAIIKTAAQMDYSKAVVLTNDYLDQIELEKLHAEEAIVIVNNLLLHKETSLSCSLKRKEVSEYLNITMDTLRNWELNGLLNVKRIDNGYRVYTSEDITRLKIIRTLRCANYSLSAILRMLNAVLEDASINIKEIIDTPHIEDDIITACDKLITSLNAAEENARYILLQINKMKKNIQLTLHFNTRVPSGVIILTKFKEGGKNMQETISVQNLSKSYGDKCVVKGVDISVNKGEIFGLLGANGAGKSTIIECLLGTKRSDSGLIRILGMDPIQDRKQLFEDIGVQFQESNYQDKINVKELCEMTQSLYSSTTDYMLLIEQFHLKDKLKSLVSELSGGQRQKLFIILALIPNPKIVFLDELTTGLDTKARRDVWKCLAQLKKTGLTIFLTSHFMDEVEALCDHIGILKNGQFVFTGTIKEAIESSSHEKFEDVYLEYAEEEYDESI